VSYRFRRKERLGPGLRRILREQADRATASIDGAEEDPAAAVHELRKTVKRMRAALRVARSRIAPPVFERHNGLYRQAAHLLRGAREADVALETLEVVISRFEGDVDGEPLERARAHLRDRGLGSLLAIAVPDGPLAQAGALLEQARGHVSELPTCSLGPRDVAEGLAWSFRRGRQHRDDAFRRREPAEFHAWRRRSKDLWHQLQLVQAAWSPVLRARASEHHRLADQLGLANDAVDLDSRLAREPDLVPDSRVRERIRSGCRELRDEAWSAARPLGRRLYAESPRAFEALMQVYLQDTFAAG
jgi:hypothetical protein